MRKAGKQRGVRYFAADASILNHGNVGPNASVEAEDEVFPFSDAAQAVLAQIRKPMSLRKPVTYQPAFLDAYRPNVSHYLSPRELDHLNAKGDTVIYFSDNESWADLGYFKGSTQVAHEWQRFKKRNPKAKLILTDLQPYGTTETTNDREVLNIGGFSDQVFKVIATFVENGNDPNHWEKLICHTAGVAQ